MVAKRIVIATLICALTVLGVLFFMRTAHAQTTIMVHAGAGIRPALDEAGAAFQKKAGVRVDYNYKGSACLLPDVCVSQKGDVYIPGELYFMQQAVDRKLVKPGYKIVASMTTVMVVQPGNPKRIDSLSDLAAPGVRLGLGDPQVVAVGRAASEALVRAGVWERVKPNMVMAAQNVTELSNAVKMRQLDAAIVWNATAALYGGKELQAIEIDPKQATCSPVPAGVLKFSKNAKAAEAYVDFLASAEGKAIFLKHGFGPPMKEDKQCEPGQK